MKINALLPGLLLAASLSLTAGAPKLEIAEKNWNAGAVAPGATIHHSFTVKNSGDAPLTILNVKPG